MNGFLKRLTARMGGAFRRAGAQTPPLAVERALILANQNPRNAPEFFRALLSQELYSLRALGSGEELAQFTDSAGEPFVPIYSEHSFIPRDLPGGYVVTTARGHLLLEKARKHRVVINPGRAAFKLFSPDDLERILSRAVRRDS